MERQELEQKIIDYVATTYSKQSKDLSLETDLKKDLGGSSILMVGLASLIENELGVLVPLPEVAACNTIEDLVNKVEEAL